MTRTADLHIVENPHPQGLQALCQEDGEVPGGTTKKPVQWGGIQEVP